MSIQSLKKHVKTVHEKIKAFKCDHCGKCFATKQNMKVHIENVHLDASNSTCDQCGKMFKTVSYLEKHVKMVHEIQDLASYKCDQCSKTFGTSSNLKRHIKTTHEMPKINLGSKNCPKENCNFEATTAAGLLKHLKSHVECDKCGKMFSGSDAKKSLKRHLKSHEKVTVTGPFKCDTCDETYPCKSYLERHVTNCQKKAKVLNEIKKFQM